MSTKAINLRTRHDGRTITVFSCLSGLELGTFKLSHVSGRANRAITNFVFGDSYALFKNDRVVIHRRPRS